MKEVICFSQCDLKRFAKYNLFILTEILHHSQLAFYEQAFRPVPQENRVFVQQSSCLFHKKIESLWNRPDSLLLTMMKYLSRETALPIGVNLSLKALRNLVFT